MLVRGTPATCGATPAGRRWKGSQIIDRQEPIPQREAIIGGWRRETKGPATKLIGNLLARPLAGGGITSSGTEKCLREKKNLLSSGFLAMREICEVDVGGGQQLRGREGDRGKKVGQNIYSGVWLLWRPGGNVPALGLTFEFSARRERHSGDQDFTSGL